MSRHKFYKGQIVKLSAEGREANIVYPRYHDRAGTVIRVDVNNMPIVLWSGRSTPTRYDPDFIESVEQQRGHAG